MAYLVCYVFDDKPESKEAPRFNYRRTIDIYLQPYRNDSISLHDNYAEMSAAKYTLLLLLVLTELKLKLIINTIYIIGS